MKIIKGLICLSIFWTMLYPSDHLSSPCNRDSSKDTFSQNTSGRNSPYGLYPVDKMASYVKKFEEKIDQLEKKLSEKKISIQTIPLSEELETDDKESDSWHPVVVAQDTDDRFLELENENERPSSFYGLCRRLSSMKSSLSRFSSEKSQKSTSNGIDSAEKKVDMLISRLVVIGKSNNLLVPYEFHSHSILDLDQGVDSQASHKSSDILSLLERQKAGITEELSKSGSFKDASLNLEIPKALSFKHVKNEKFSVPSAGHSYADSYIVQAVRTSSDRKCDSQLFGKEELSDEEERELKK